MSAASASAIAQGGSSPNACRSWVRVERVHAVGPADDFVDSIKLADSTRQFLLVGVIQPGSRPLRKYFLASRNRFPKYGGHAVVANAAVTARVRWRDEASTAKDVTVATFSAAGGAFVDLEARL